MGFVQNNKVDFRFGIETALETPATSAWVKIQRTNIDRFGNVDGYVSDEPVSSNRRRQSSLLVSRRSGLAFSDNLRLGTMRYFLPGVLSATPTTLLGYGRVPAAATDGGGGGRLHGSCWRRAGLGTSSSSAASKPGTTVQGRDHWLGREHQGAHRLAGGRDPTATPASTSPACRARRDFASTPTVTSPGGCGPDFTTLGLVRQVIWVGGATAGTSFATAADRGFVQLDVIAAHLLTISHRTAAFTTDTGSGKTIQLLYGEFVRDLDTDDASYLMRTHHAEVSYPGIGDSNETYYRYGKGLACNMWTLGMPLEGAMTSAYDFVGTQTTDHIAAGSRITGPSTAIEPLQKLGFSTAIHHMRLLIDSADVAVNTHFKTWSVQIANNITGSYYQGQLAALAISQGQVLIDVDTTWPTRTSSCRRPSPRRRCSASGGATAAKTADTTCRCRRAHDRQHQHLLRRREADQGAAHGRGGRDPRPPSAYPSSRTADQLGGLMSKFDFSGQRITDKPVSVPVAKLWPGWTCPVRAGGALLLGYTGSYNRSTATSWRLSAARPGVPRAAKPWQAMTEERGLVWRTTRPKREIHRDTDRVLYPWHQGMVWLLRGAGDWCRGHGHARPDAVHSHRLRGPLRRAVQARPGVDVR
jgi:hypothetical protein